MFVSHARSIIHARKERYDGVDRYKEIGAQSSAHTHSLHKRRGLVLIMTTQAVNSLVMNISEKKPREK